MLRDLCLRSRYIMQDLSFHKNWDATAKERVFPTQKEIIDAKEGFVPDDINPTLKQILNGFIPKRVIPAKPLHPPPVSFGTAASTASKRQAEERGDTGGSHEAANQELDVGPRGSDVDGPDSNHQTSQTCLDPSNEHGLHATPDHTEKQARRSLQDPPPCCQCSSCKCKHRNPILSIPEQAIKEFKNLIRGGLDGADVSCFFKLLPCSDSLR